jgi:hypothetical protein
MMANGDVDEPDQRSAKRQMRVSSVKVSPFSICTSNVKYEHSVRSLKVAALDVVRKLVLRKGLVGVEIYSLDSKGFVQCVALATHPYASNAICDLLDDYLVDNFREAGYCVSDELSCNCQDAEHESIGIDKVAIELKAVQAFDREKGVYGVSSDTFCDNSEALEEGLHIFPPMRIGVDTFVKFGEGREVDLVLNNAVVVVIEAALKVSGQKMQFAKCTLSVSPELTNESVQMDLSGALLRAAEKEECEGVEELLEAVVWKANEKYGKVEVPEDKEEKEEEEQDKEEKEEGEYEEYEDYNEE